MTALALSLAISIFQAPQTEEPWRAQDYKSMRSSSHNKDDMSNDDSWRLPAGQTITLLDAKGPGMVTHIWTTIADNEYAWPRLLRLRVYYDGAKKPSVDTPLGDFFACGHGLERDINSMMVRNTSQGRARNCYWKMPFLKGCRITLSNEGAERAWLTYFQVDWRKYKSLPKDTMYFHALYRQEMPAQMGKRYVILETKGKGAYVGTVLNVIPHLPGWFGEGDEFFFVDGEKNASLKGTGTEDFISDGWGLHEHSGPYYGTSSAGGFGVGDRVSAYRWQIPDPVPFQNNLRIEIEHAGWVFTPEGKTVGSFVERDDDFSSVAFWYQTPFRTDLPDYPQGKARLPYGNATVIQAESLLPRVNAQKGVASLQKEVFWLQDIVFFNAEGEGSYLTIPFEVPEDGKWEIMPLILSSYDYGIYSAELDGKPVGPRMNLYASETLMPKGYPLGRFDMKKGSYSLKFRCLGKSGESSAHYFGIDQIILSKVRS
jgi:hypothetical protein